MAKYKHKTYYQVKEIFTPNKYKQFKKGELYRDPRIQQQGGQKDFLILSNKEADFEMLESYLKNELVPRYPSEPYNMFTTGCDSNGTPMIGLYWMDESMDQKKVAIILCNDGCEESVLAIVDDNCLEMGEKRVIDKLNEEDVKTNVGNELVGRSEWVSASELGEVSEEQVGLRGDEKVRHGASCGRGLRYPPSPPKGIESVA